MIINTVERIYNLSIEENCPPRSAEELYELYLVYKKQGNKYVKQQKLYKHGDSI